jgi:uncharacterized protein (DUF2336 family)
MLAAHLNSLLDAKREGERIRIAQRAGRRLTLADLPAAERQAAEAIARCLAEDAIETVRQALSEAVRQARFLPRDIALRIAHDIDAVACPFLAVTEVFSDEDWQQLVLTLSRDALITVARRSPMSEALAIGIAERGDTVAAETLIANPSAPMTPAVLTPLVDRFKNTTWVLDQLAERSDLGAEIAVTLVGMVSSAASRKLSARYNLDNYVVPNLIEAEIASIIRLARNIPPSRYPVIASTLRDKGKITLHLLEQTLREGPIAFFEAILSAATGLPVERVRGLVRADPPEALKPLLRKAQIPASVHDELLLLVQEARRRR